MVSPTDPHWLLSRDRKGVPIARGGLPIARKVAAGCATVATAWAGEVGCALDQLKP
jgi:hypothetical protein